VLPHLWWCVLKLMAQGINCARFSTSIFWTRNHTADSLCAILLPYSTQQKFHEEMFQMWTKGYFLATFKEYGYRISVPTHQFKTWQLHQFIYIKWHIHDCLTIGATTINTTAFFSITTTLAKIITDNMKINIIFKFKLSTVIIKQNLYKKSLTALFERMGTICKRY